MQLLSRTNPDGLHLASGGDGLREVQQPHAGDLGNKNLAAVHLLQAADHELHALLERQPESGHASIGNRDLPAPALFQKNRDHASPAAHHVPIARTTEARIFRACIGIGLHKHLLRAQLGGAVEIDRIHRLVGRERQNATHALIDSRIDDVAAAHNVGLDRFKRVVLASRHLLERRRVHHHRHPRERPLQPLDVPHVPDEIPHAGMIEARRPHFMLLQLVAAEHHQPLRVVVAQHDLDELLPERSGPTCYQYRFLRPVHHPCPFETSSVKLRNEEKRAPRIRASLQRCRKSCAQTPLQGLGVEDRRFAQLANLRFSG